MRAVATLTVLFFICGAQTHRVTDNSIEPESQRPESSVGTQTDLSAELKRLRDMAEMLEGVVVELKGELSMANTELQHSRQQVVQVQKDIEAQQSRNAAMETDMNTMKTEMVNLINKCAPRNADLATLKTEVENLKGENTALKARMSTTRTETMKLIRDGAAQEAELTVLRTRLGTSESEVEKLKQETGTQGGRLTATESSLENLQTQIAATTKVAFSAGLTLYGTEYLEAKGNDMNLVFSNILTNVGQAYSNSSGFFKAPVKGVYFIRFTVRDMLDDRQMGIKMCKNGNQVMFLYEHAKDGHATYLSSGVTLQLEVGDEVNLQLPADKRLHENNNNHNMFSGFLLFPL